MNSELPVSADALLAERARLEEELQSSEDWRELLRLKSRKDRGEPISAVNAARLELVLIDALSQDPAFVRYKAVCVALERLIRGLPPLPPEKTEPERPDDDLTQIRGISPSMARRLKALEVSSFADIAGWTSDDIQYFSRELGIGRQITKQKWVDQAAKFAALASPQLHDEGEDDDDPGPDDLDDHGDDDAITAALGSADVAVVEPNEDAGPVEGSRSRPGLAPERLVVRRLDFKAKTSAPVRPAEPAAEHDPAVEMKEHAPEAESSDSASALDAQPKIETEPVQPDVATAGSQVAPEPAARMDDAQPVVSADFPVSMPHEPPPEDVERVPDEAQAGDDSNPVIPEADAPSEPAEQESAAAEDQDVPIPPLIPPQPEPTYAIEPVFLSVSDAPATAFEDAVDEIGHGARGDVAEDAASVPQSPPPHSDFAEREISKEASEIENAEAREDADGHGVEPRSLLARLEHAGEGEEAGDVHDPDVDATPPPIEPMSWPHAAEKSRPETAPMSIDEAIAYAAELARQGSKAEPAPTSAEQSAYPPPPPPSRPPHSAPPSVVHYEPPASAAAPPSSFSRPARRDADRFPSAPVTDGAETAYVVPPPLPADFVASPSAAYGGETLEYENGHHSGHHEPGLSKIQIEEATVEIVHKVEPTQAPTPRMIIRPAQVAESEQSERQATPIGRFLKALTGN